MTTRRRLPNRRPSETITYECRGQKIDATVGYAPNGRISEAFIRSGKAGTDLSISMIEAGIALSFALQCGANIEAMREAFPRTEDGRAEGAIGQLLDLLARPEPTLEVVQ